MNVHKYIGYAFLLMCMISCGAKANVDTAVEQTAESATVSDTTAENTTDNELINRIYDKFVFAIDTDGNDNPEDYFTANALKKLQQDYDFDCEYAPCYAYYALRTGAQDSKPDSEDVSKISKVEHISDGWYEVSYIDMGWSGMTRVKVVDRRIDDYERCAPDL